MDYAVFDTGWGAFGFVARDNRLVETFLPRRKTNILRELKDRWPDAVEAPHLLRPFQREVIDYFAGRRRRFKVQIDLSELPLFRQAVLEACRRIPYGQTASYADLARAVGKPGAARAVGGAMAHNPLPLVIPCHRVLRSDGSLGGFSSTEGTGEKEHMLRLEHALPDVLQVSPRARRRRSVRTVGRAARAG